MEIVSKEEVELKVATLFKRGLIDVVKIGKEHDREFISQKFDYLKLTANPYSTWYNVEPIELQYALANASSIMGDEFIYLSCVGYILEPEIPIHFKFPVEELLTKEVYLLMGEAEDLANKGFLNVLIYSQQGLWAALLEADYYGTIGMTKDFLTLVRSIYPQLDEELDKQLFDFIRWCNDDPSVPDEWEYIPGDKGASHFFKRVEGTSCQFLYFVRL